MNGNVFFIKVYTTSGKVDYVNIDAIEQITTIDSGTMIVTNRASTITSASIEDVYEAIASHSSVAINVPEVGFPKNEPIVIAAESDDNDPDTLDSRGMNPEMREIAKIVDFYEKSSRYRSSAAAIEQAYPVSINVGDKTEVVEGIAIEGDEIFVGIKGEDHDLRRLADLGEEAIESILGRMREPYAWDVVYEWLMEKAEIDEYVAIYNASQPESRHILDNTEENINKFNLSAGALAKSMINGRYKKDDDYILVSDGDELVSTSQDYVCEWIEGPTLADWLLENREVAEDMLPEHIFREAF